MDIFGEPLLCLLHPPPLGHGSQLSQWVSGFWNSSQNLLVPGVSNRTQLLARWPAPQTYRVLPSHGWLVSRPC